MPGYFKTKIFSLATQANHYLGFIDRFIENKFLNYFQKKKPKIVTQFLSECIAKHPEINSSELKNILENEADRVCHFTDRAILRANIKKGKYAFWITAIGSTVLVLAVSGFKTPLSFVSPPISSLLTYIGTLASIVALYNQRVKGAMVDKVKSYEKTLEIEQNNLLAVAQISPELILQKGQNIATIGLDFIPSNIQINTLLKGYVTITLTKAAEVEEDLEQKESLLGPTAMPTISALHLVAESDLTIQWNDWHKRRGGRASHPNNHIDAIPTRSAISP